jgi:adenylosuccinate lyase
MPLRANQTVIEVLTPKELDEVMDPDNYLGKAPEMVDHAIAQAEAKLGRKIL